MKLNEAINLLENLTDKKVILEDSKLKDMIVAGKKKFFNDIKGKTLYHSCLSDDKNGTAKKSIMKNGLNQYANFFSVGKPEMSLEEMKVKNEFTVALKDFSNYLSNIYPDPESLTTDKNNVPKEIKAYFDNQQKSFAGGTYMMAFDAGGINKNILFALYYYSKPVFDDIWVLIDTNIPASELTPLN